jgi:diguanylate cyclase (GGDEF)-like protein
MGHLDRFFTIIRDWRRATLMVLVLFLCLAGGFLQGRHIALERVDAIFDQSSASRKNLFRLEIQGALSVPQVLAASRSVQWLLDAPNSIAVEEENAVLEETARNVGLDVIYVMDVNGTCVAASNWRAPDSFVGENYAFRSYFTQAMAGQTGRYIAKGVTSMKVGYYLSRPVKVDGDIRGIVVAKMSFDTLRARIEEFWRNDRELDLVTDENGVVVVSPLNDLVFKSIHPIPDETRSAIIASREYGNQMLPIPLKLGSVLSDQVRFVEFDDIPGHSFLQKSYYFPDLGLRLYLHLPVSVYWGIVAEFTTIFSLLAFVIFLIGVIIFQRWGYESELLETAIRDPLTGLSTRLYMNDWCEAAISAHNRDPNAGFGLGVFDLDFFKQVNDEYGHLVGDDVLKRVGEIVRGVTRREDLAVRYGGEELAVFMRCENLAEAVRLAERIRHSVEQFEFRDKTERVPVTLSGGVAYHIAGEPLDVFFARADKMLYEAKGLGRNRIVA